MAVDVVDVALDEYSSSEFSTPNDDGVVEEATLGEVFDQGGGRLIGVAALEFELGGKVAMLIPARVHELDEAYSALDEATSEEAVVGVGAFFLDIGSIHFEDVLGFLGDVGEVGHTGLHAEGKFVLRDAGFDFGVAVVLESLFVKFLDIGEDSLAEVGGHSGRVGEIQNRVTFAAESDALVLRREEARAPIVVVEELTAGVLFVGGSHDHVGGKVFGHVSQAVGAPSTHAWSARNLATGKEEGDTGGVVDGLGVHGFDQRDVVCDAAGVGEHFAHPRARFAVLLEGFDGGQDREVSLTAGHSGEACAFADGLGEFFEAMLC